MSKASYIIIVAILMFIFITGCEQTPAVTPTQTSGNSLPVGYPPVATISSPAKANQGYAAPAVSTPGYPAPGVSAPGYPAPGGSTLQIISASGQSKPLSAVDLGQLPTSVVETMTGPKLGDVLLLAGIKDYASITVTGSNGSLELTKDKINDQIIISLDNNTFTLVIAGTPKEQWIKAITTIAVK